MGKRGSHSSKTPQYRQAYGRYIQTLDYEPTLNEGIDFGSTGKAGEELSESTSRRPARGHTRFVIREHFRDHWVEWIVGALVILALFLVNESRVTTAIMTNTLSDTKSAVEQLTSDVKTIDQKVNKLELDTVSNIKDIEYLKNK